MTKVHLIRFHSLPHYFGAHDAKSRGTYKTKIAYFKDKTKAKKCAREMNKFYKKNRRIPTLKDIDDMMMRDKSGLSEYFVVCTMDKDNLDYVLAMANLGSVSCNVDEDMKLSYEEDIHIELCADVHRDFLETLMYN